jgi:DNA-binding transcriptional ArsR family regulator
MKKSVLRSQGNQPAPGVPGAEVETKLEKDATRQTGVWPGGGREMSLDSLKSEATTQVDRHSCDSLSPEDMMEEAQSAANFLKALAHEGRLMILCHLGSGEKSVTELENLLSSRQAAVSQQLARLRLEGLVSCRRDGKAIYYSLSDPKVQRTIDLVYDLFCKPA